jgi:hypothetical protein
MALYICFQCAWIWFKSFLFYFSTLYICFVLILEFSILLIWNFTILMQPFRNYTNAQSYQTWELDQVKYINVWQYQSSFLYLHHLFVCTHICRCNLCTMGLFFHMLGVIFFNLCMLCTWYSYLTVHSTR